MRAGGASLRKFFNAIFLMPNSNTGAYIFHITNLPEQEIRFSEEVRISHQSLIVEVTEALPAKSGRVHVCVEIDEGDSRRQIKKQICAEQSLSVPVCRQLYLT